MATYYQLDPFEQTSVKFESQHKENAFENVICKISAILFWVQLCQRQPWNNKEVW